MTEESLAVRLLRMIAEGESDPEVALTALSAHHDQVIARYEAAQQPPIDARELVLARMQYYWHLVGYAAVGVIAAAQRDEAGVDQLEAVLALVEKVGLHLYAVQSALDRYTDAMAPDATDEQKKQGLAVAHISNDLDEVKAVLERHAIL
jgi:hypothetical protein